MFRFLFQKYHLRSLELENRIICGPMEKNLCDEFGIPSEKYADYVEERAKGNAGLIILESAYVHWTGRARKYQMGIHDDSVIPALRRVVDRAHRYGTPVAMQLHHGGRTCQEAIIGVQPVAPSPVACQVLAGGDVPREMSRNEIEFMIDQFRQAARRSITAGVDALEIHGAHGYLIGQFLSPYSNLRTDEYGGEFENRCRFPLEVIRTVREEVGPNVPLIYRISADEFIDGGLTLEDTIAFARILDKEEIDLINISAGIYESGVMIVQPMEFPLGGYVYMARAYKDQIRTPVSVAGRISDPYQAEAILAEGSADFVTMVRAFHADPYFPRKAMQGRFEDICLCIACNQGCADRLRENVPLSCILNPWAGHERQFRIEPTKTPKKVWVAGGGPAGLMAAKTAALRGHRVSLFERDEELGGQARRIARVTHKEDFSQGIRFFISSARKAGVSIESGTELDVNRLREGHPDILVVATGSKPVPPDIIGINECPCHTYLEALDNPERLGSRVAVCGGGFIAGETALFLAQLGRNVILISEETELVPDIGPRAKWYLLNRLEQCQEIEVIKPAQPLKLEPGRLWVQTNDQEEVISDLNDVVFAAERLPETRLCETVKDSGLSVTVLTVGDCVQPASITEATHQAVASSIDF